MTDDLSDASGYAKAGLGLGYLAGSTFKAVIAFTEMGANRVPKTVLESITEIAVAFAYSSSAIIGGIGLCLWYRWAYLARIAKQKSDDLDRERRRIEDHEYRMAELKARRCQCDQVDTAFPNGTPNDETGKTDH